MVLGPDGRDLIRHCPVEEQEEPQGSGGADIPHTPTARGGLKRDPHS